jgi:glycosyltransferase involved in cell wall biosynthesis
MGKKKIAMVLDMYEHSPPTRDPAAAIQISAMHSAIFLAGTRGHDVTVYAPEASGLLEYARSIAANHGWKHAMAEDGHCIQLTDEEGHQGSLRLRGPQGLEPYGLRCEEDKKFRYEQALFNLVSIDHQRNPYDVIHTDFLFEDPYDSIVMGLKRDVRDKMVETVHGLDISRQYDRYRTPVIAISQNQSERLREQGGDILGVVHHGLDDKMHTASEQSAGYLTFIGRMTPEKGPHLAIEAARLADRPLVIASKIKPWEKEYFEAHIMPQVTVVDEQFLDKHKTPEALRKAIEDMHAPPGQPPIIFVGSADAEQRKTLYDNAYATLFPIIWNEPFGLVRAESIAHGTPLISIGQYGHLKCGAVGEQIEDGRAGVALSIPHSDDAKEMERMAARKMVEALHAIDARVAEHGEAHVRREVRQTFDEHCTLKQNAANLDECFDAFMARGRIAGEGAALTGHSSRYRPSRKMAQEAKGKGRQIEI